MSSEGKKLNDIISYENVFGHFSDKKECYVVVKHLGSNREFCTSFSRSYAGVLTVDIYTPKESKTELVKCILVEKEDAIEFETERCGSFYCSTIPTFQDPIFVERIKKFWSRVQYQTRREII